MIKNLRESPHQASRVGVKAGWFNCLRSKLVFMICGRVSEEKQEVVCEGVHHSQIKSKEQKGQAWTWRISHKLNFLRIII